MKRSQFSEEQIIAILREQGEGAKTVEVCRKHGISDATFGRALFDTGLHPDCQHDPAGRLGPRLAGLFRIGFRPGWV
jgi:Transposase